MLFTVLAKEWNDPTDEPFKEIALNTERIREARRRFDGTTEVNTDYGKIYDLSMRWDEFNKIVVGSRRNANEN